MRIAIGSDHAGYELKCQLVNYLQHNNVEVHDMGTFNQDSVDYPDYAVQVCQTLARDNSDFGILICYTGIDVYKRQAAGYGNNLVRNNTAILASPENMQKLEEEKNQAMLREAELVQQMKELKEKIERTEDVSYTHLFSKNGNPKFAISRIF